MIRLWLGELAPTSSVGPGAHTPYRTPSPFYKSSGLPPPHPLLLVRTHPASHEVGEDATAPRSHDGRGRHERGMRFPPPSRL